MQEELVLEFPTQPSHACPRDLAPGLLSCWCGFTGAVGQGRLGTGAAAQLTGWSSNSAGHGVGEGVGSWRPPGMRMMVTTRKVAMPDRMLNMVSRV